MPDLYIGVLGAPYRAVVAYADGRRAFVKIGDRRENEFALEPVVWVDQEGAVVGAQANVLERSGNLGETYRIALGETAVTEMGWSERDLLAAAFKRFLSAAENQTGEAIARMTCVIPSDVRADVRASCVQAGLLAGAQQVDVLPLESSIVPGEAIVEVWDDRARATILSDSGERTTLDLSMQISKAGFRRAIGERFTLPPDLPLNVHDDLESELFDRWVSGKDASAGATLTRPVARGAPLSVFVPPAAFARFDENVLASLKLAFAARDIAPERLRSIRVIGSWTRPIAAALRALCGPGVPLRDQRGLELDAAIAALPPAAHAAPATLVADLMAVAPSARTLRALSQGEPVLLLRSGARLPATSVLENFASSAFIDTFWVATRTAPDETTPILGFAIPRYAERQPTSYLRAVVHCDTPAFMLLEVAYLYPSHRRIAFFDKELHREIPVPSHVWSLRG